VEGVEAPGRLEYRIHARDELDVMRGEVLLGFPQRLVEAAERRAAIAGDEAGRVEAGGLIAPALHQRQAHQRLNTGEVDSTLIGGVLVLQRHFSHARLLLEFALETLSGFWPKRVCVETLDR